ncbi:hypothetical protein SCHPADRAFT_897086, partial [Schizopora paradoxa]
NFYKTSGRRIKIEETANVLEPWVGDRKRANGAAGKLAPEITEKAVLVHLTRRDAPISLRLSPSFHHHCHPHWPSRPRAQVEARPFDLDLGLWFRKFVQVFSVELNGIVPFKVFNSTWFSLLAFAPSSQPETAALREGPR